MTDTPQAKRDLPLWAGIAIVALGAIIAGWFVWSQVSGFWSGPSGVFQIPGMDPNAPARVNRAAPRTLQRQLAVREINKTEWRVRAVPYSLVIRQPEGKPVSVSMNVSSTRLLPADAQWVLVTKPRLDEKAAASIGLTPEQVKQFKALPTSMAHRLTPSAAQNKQLEEAFDKWRKADAAQKTTADTELSDLTTSIGQSLLPALQTQLNKSYEDAKKSLTPEKWEKLKGLGTSAPATP